MSKRLSTETHEQQSLLAAFCRTGIEPALEGTTPGRLSHYRRLVYNVVTDALARTYPLTVNLLSDAEWSQLCHDFFEKHPCQEAQVWKMPFELIGYVETNEKELIHEYPHLLTLLHFEWKEVEYYMMPDREVSNNTGGDFWDEVWSISPESEVMKLLYPVHTKNAKLIEVSDQGEYYCLVHRHPETGKVHFMNLSSFFAWLLEAMVASQSSPKQLFPEVRSNFGIHDEAYLKSQLQFFWEKLVSSHVILT